MVRVGTLMLSRLSSLTLLLKKNLTRIVSCVTRSDTSNQETTTSVFGSSKSIKVIYIRKGHLPGHEWYEQKFVHSYHHDQGGYAIAVKHEEPLETTRR
jgi:hypothetical protein